MMLPIFPESGLAGSVITAVWIGVWVVCLCNLRFGWVLSGLVVPGYLAPLWIVEPFSAALDCFEAVLTYGVVAIVARLGARLGLWATLFGRDRFFAFVLASVFVRLTVDTVGMAPLAELSAWAGYGDITRGGSLQSFGLVVIALMANQLWKPGLIRGLGPMALQIGVTWFILRYVLMEYTNFSIGTLSFMYEDLASSVLASPKAYMILLCTAWIASRYNLRYGWDYNGILLPSLLALQWYEPLKLLSTFAEAWVIFMLASRLKMVPLFSGAAAQGAGKILLFFNVGFAYKYVLGWVAPLVWPPLNVVDLYGFGFLLSTLLALRMDDKSTPLLLPRIALQTSLAGVLIATVIGYVLSLLPLAAKLPAAAAPPAIAAAPLPAVLLDFYGVAPPLNLEAGDLRRFGTALRSLQDSTAPSAEQRDARAELQRQSFAVVQPPEGGLRVEDSLPGRSRGVHWLWPQNTGPLVVEVPPGQTDWWGLLAAVRLAQALDARALHLSGGVRGTPNAAPEADARLQAAYAEAALAASAGTPLWLRQTELAAPRLVLADNRLQDFDLRRLEALLGEPLRVVIEPAAVAARLELPTRLIHHLVQSIPTFSPVAATRVTPQQALNAYVATFETTVTVASGLTEGPRAAFMNLLLQPLCSEASAGLLTDTAQIGRYSGLLALLGYRMTLGDENGPVAVVVPASGAADLGGFRVRLGTAAPVAVDLTITPGAPQIRATGERLADALHARVTSYTSPSRLQVAESVESDADVVPPQTAPAQPLPLLLRACLGRSAEPPLLLQLRAPPMSMPGGWLALPEDDRSGGTPPGVARLLAALSKLGLPVQRLEGAAASAGLEVNLSAELLLRDVFDQAAFAIYYPAAAEAATPLSGSGRVKAAQRQFVALNLPVVTAPSRYEAQRPDTELGQQLSEYAQSLDIARLAALARRNPSLRLGLEISAQGEARIRAVTHEGVTLRVPIAEQGDVP